MISENSSVEYLDLRGTPCPLNFIKCRLALELLESNDSLKVDIDCGEPEVMVISALKNAGHQVEIICKETSWIRLMVVCGARSL